MEKLHTMEKLRKNGDGTVGFCRMGNWSTMHLPHLNGSSMHCEVAAR
jgi:hypothetical protein